MSEPTTRVVGSSWLRTAAKTVCVVLLGLFTMQPASAQLDPDDPWPKFGRDEAISCRSPNRGPHGMLTLKWWTELNSANEPGDENHCNSLASVGFPEGVNALGVADCNNDLVVDNADVDCFLAYMCTYCEEACSEEFSRPGECHVCDVVAFLRALAGA